MSVLGLHGKSLIHSRLAWYQKPPKEYKKSLLICSFPYYKGASKFGMDVQKRTNRAHKKKMFKVFRGTILSILQLPSGEKMNYLPNQ